MAKPQLEKFSAERHRVCAKNLHPYPQNTPHVVHHRTQSSTCRARRAGRHLFSLWFVCFPCSHRPSTPHVPTLTRFSALTSVALRPVTPVTCAVQGQAPALPPSSPGPLTAGAARGPCSPRSQRALPPAAALPPCLSLAGRGAEMVSGTLSVWAQMSASGPGSSPRGASPCLHLPPSLPPPASPSCHLAENQLPQSRTERALPTPPPPSRGT